MNSKLSKETKQNSPSSCSLSPKICFCNKFYSCKDCKQLYDNRHDALANYMPHQDLSDASPKSDKSAPVKQSVQCLANPGYLMKNGENMNMMITKENYKLCCK